MKKIVFSIAAVLFMYIAFSQNPQLPPGTTPGQVPVPDNLRPVAPPDLRVEEFSLVSVVRDIANKKINIQLRITIRNYGGMFAGNSTVVGYMKSPSGTGIQRTLAQTLPVEKINPGASFTKVYTFRQPESNFTRPGQFDCWIKADGKNNITESNETNNTSAVIIITVPAT